MTWIPQRRSRSSSTRRTTHRGKPDQEHPLALALARAYKAESGRQPEWGYWGFGDMNLFSEEAGIPTVMIGPRGDNFHQADEWVDVPSIAATSRLLVRMALDLLA